MASEKTKPIKAEDLFQQGFEGGTQRNDTLQTPISGLPEIGITSVQVG